MVYQEAPEARGTFSGYLSPDRNDESPNTLAFGVLGLDQVLGFRFSIQGAGFRVQVFWILGLGFLVYCFVLLDLIRYLNLDF